VRDRLVTLLKVVISLGLIVLAFVLVDIRAVGAQLRQARPVFVAAALAVYIVAIIINGLKWQVLLRAQNINVPFGAVLRFLFTGFFFNNFLPANVGGDVMRGYGLARYTDRTADAAVSVIVDRVIGLVAYMSTAVVAAIVAVNFTGHKELQQVEWVAILALATLTLGFGVLLSRRLRSLIDRLFQWRFLAPLAPIWGRVSDAFNAYRFRYDSLVLAYGIALLGILSTTLVNWLVSQSMGGLMPLPIIFLFNPLIALVMTLPISIGGIGVSQTAYPFFFGLAGVPAAHATAVSIIMQGIQFVGSLPGGVLWLTGRRKASQPEAQVN
jgi:glycosyltransferase 2 family protein